MSLTSLCPRALLLCALGRVPQDVLFKECRDCNFAALGPFLHKKAEMVKVTYEERHGAQSVHDLHAFLPKFKTANTEHTLLQLHVNLARAIAQVTKTTKFDRRQEAEGDALRLRNAKECDEYVEQMIWKMENKIEMYRYLCLVSHTVGIRNQKRFDALKHEIISSYGFAELVTLEHLERTGLFRRPSKKKYWATARKHFNVGSESNAVGWSSFGAVLQFFTVVAAVVAVSLCGIPVCRKLVFQAVESNFLSCGEAAMFALCGDGFEPGYHRRIFHRQPKHLCPPHIHCPAFTPCDNLSNSPSPPC